MAAAGVPEPRQDHALIMCRFANECRSKMVQVVKRLEVLLGPDTAELKMRFGLHSGSVTAGVLRGEKSRFQLFGDTVNTASRMESTSLGNEIQLSSTTANLLIESGRDDWVKKRDEVVIAKGKGEMETYFLVMKTRDRLSGGASVASANEMTESPGDDSILKPAAMSGKLGRLVDWNVENLSQQLRQIIAMRGNNAQKTSLKSFRSQHGKTVLDEVREIIALPDKPSDYKIDPFSVELGSAALSQLHEFVVAIAQGYHDNPFHSFEHASHVTQSVTKLLARVVTPNDAIDYTNLQYKNTEGETKQHEYTFGITSDPLTQFACTFSALIHDLDHYGITNATLVTEKDDLATKYNNKSVAEQNSVDLAWSLLMQDQFVDLRACIYSTQAELDRFRQLVVNSVMATDIVDKELGALRKKRWAKAFYKDGIDKDAIESSLDDSNRKATIVIEHIIQASDVSHTMQHWHVYVKWNRKLFGEMLKAYKDGRTDNHPADGWYAGELGFFEFYIIPLAKKLKDCGVFGVASDEYLSYAMANRAEWEQKGMDVVKGYLEYYE